MQVLEVLPVAPPPPPRQLTEQEQQQLEELEEDTLRELRLFLRDVTNRLAQDKRFKIFTRPVDLEEVPDYTTVIRQPMDLSTLLSNIDAHKYVTVKDFLHDVDLIWKNALEYNPDRDPSDRLIRHRACALKDTVRAIIKDQLDEDFEKICLEIKESRSKRGCTGMRFAPSFYHVQPKSQASTEKAADTAPSKDASSAGPSAASTPRSAYSTKKRRRKSRWCNGYITKKKSSSHPRDAESLDEEEEDEDEAEGEEDEDERMEAVEAQEEETLKKLRLLLCDITNRLSQDERFQVFSEPVDPEEVPDYASVIKEPMDLSTVLSKIKSEKYLTEKDYLHDVDLIWMNALEYNPEADSEGRVIRKQAVALKTSVHTLLKAELDEELQEACLKIQEARSSRALAASTAKDASSTPCTPTTSHRRRRRRSRWSSGIHSKKKSHCQSRDSSAAAESLDDEEEEEEEAATAARDPVEEAEKATPAPQPTDQAQPATTEAAGEPVTAAESTEAAASKEAEEVAMETEEVSLVAVAGGDHHDPPSPLAGEALVNGPAPSGGASQSEKQDTGKAEPESMATEIKETESAAAPETTEAPQVEPETARSDKPMPDVEEDTGVEMGTRRMTRALKHQVQQQRQVISLDTAMRILEQKTPPLVVDHSKLQSLLHKVVAKTEGYEVDRLEKLYALLCQSVYRHRKEYDKTTLLNEMENEIDNFE